MPDGRKEKNNPPGRWSMQQTCVRIDQVNAQDGGAVMSRVRGVFIVGFVFFFGGGGGGGGGRSFFF